MSEERAASFLKAEDYTSQFRQALVVLYL